MTKIHTVGNSVFASANLWQTFMAIILSSSRGMESPHSLTLIALLNTVFPVFKQFVSQTDLGRGDPVDKCTFHGIEVGWIDLDSHASQQSLCFRDQHNYIK
jgi:hypothetical protein